MRNCKLIHVLKSIYFCPPLATVFYKMQNICKAAGNPALDPLNKANSVPPPSTNQLQRVFCRVKLLHEAMCHICLRLFVFASIDLGLHHSLV